MFMFPYPSTRRGGKSVTSLEKVRRCRYPEGRVKSRDNGLIDGREGGRLPIYGEPGLFERPATGGDGGWRA